MIGLLKRATLTPAEELANRKLVQEVHDRRDRVVIGKEWRVTLDEENGLSREEYPDRWVGVELDRDECDLILLRFPKAFVGKGEKGGSETKTKKRGQHRYTMWVPDWLLKEFTV